MFSASRPLLATTLIHAGWFGFTICCGMALAAPPTGYRLAWQDEFDGDTLDQAKWQYRTDTRYWSTQLPANVSVSNGLLNLHLKKETVGTVDYTAGGVISRNLVRYGYYEASMKVPPGRGWHTSFWMMKYNRPTTDTVAIELDVIENDSVTPLKYAVNVHRHLPAPHVAVGTKTVTTQSLSSAFHLFGCEFTPSTIKYFYDGLLVQTVDATQLPHDDMNIWLTSIAAPLGGTTSVDDSQLPAVAQYEYVRFYEPFPAPVVSITNPSAAAITLPDATATLHLEASITGSSMVAWSLVDGPGNVTFSDPTTSHTHASFSAPGTYTLQCSASNEGGTNIDRLNVGVAAPAIIELREQIDGYQHTATVIRGDQPGWNAGARDQLLVGRTTAPFRSLFSFDLSPISNGAIIHEASLDLRAIGGIGTISDLQLRALSATPVEGTGTADGSSGSDLGIGTGATWASRTGGNSPPDLWVNSGGDYPPEILSEAPGFDASIIGQALTIPTTPALTAATQAAHAAAKPLDLILSATNESLSSIAYARLASDNASLETDRPKLRISFSGNVIPTVDPGNAPAAIHNVATNLAGIASNAELGTLWSLVSGPGAAEFGNTTLAATTVTFSEMGDYVLRFSARNTLGQSSRTLTISVAPNPGIFTDWQSIHWPGISDITLIGDTVDPDHDEHSNFLEFATGQDPRSVTGSLTNILETNGEFEFRYTRNKAALDQGYQFDVEYSDTLSGPWYSIGPGDVISDGATQSVNAVIPASLTTTRFARLKVYKP